MPGLSKAGEVVGQKFEIRAVLGRGGYQAFLNGATPLQASEIQQARRRLAELKAAPAR
jgi:hypothetical protein